MMHLPGMSPETKRKLNEAVAYVAEALNIEVGSKGVPSDIFTLLPVLVEAGAKADLTLEEYTIFVFGFGFNAEKRE